MVHPDARIRMIAAFADDPDLNWNLAVGMIGPDNNLRAQIDAALSEMLADGTIARIYARYGIELRRRSEGRQAVGETGSAGLRAPNSGGESSLTRLCDESRIASYT
jgi:hypothetical protein